MVLLEFLETIARLSPLVTVRYCAPPMEPLTPNDPLWKLMSKARPVVPRPDFTQNVLRAARQQGQDTGWWPQISDWLLPGAAR